MMLRSHKAVLAHVALGPVQVGVGEVDRHGLLDAAVRRVAGGGAGIGKQVEEAARLLGVLTHQVAGDAVIQEDAHIQIVVKVDGKGEAALFDERQTTACDVGALARRALAGALFAVLRAAARTHAGLGVHMLGRNIKDARRDGQDVEHAGLGQRGIDGLGRGVFGDDEPAARRLRAALVQVDGGGVVGQVGIVDAVAAHALALGPLAAQTGILAQAVGELLGLGDEHGQRLAVAQVEHGGHFRAFCKYIRQAIVAVGEHGFFRGPGTPQLAEQIPGRIVAVRHLRPIVRVEPAAAYILRRSFQLFVQPVFQRPDMSTARSIRSPDASAETASSGRRR